jgi:Sulfatase-modifying factor enzyme 1
LKRLLICLAILSSLAPQGFADPPTRTSRDGLIYVWIPPGSYVTGCLPGDTDCNGLERPGQKIVLSGGFWIGRTEVTQSAYLRIMGIDPSRYKGADLPVDSVSWPNATAYCQRIGMRLPTESEWEYAAYGGTTQLPQEPLGARAWLDPNSDDQTHPVGTKLPNGYGLVDMLGNVWEWVQDAGIEPGEHILKGGSFYNSGRDLRVSNRLSAPPGLDHRDIGFRCASSQSSPPRPMTQGPASPMAQNPSPMVEHTRAHPRLTEERPPGERYSLSLGTLFVPAASEHRTGVRLLFFFHGGDWLPEVAVAREKRMAVVTIQAGAGSSRYAALFADPARFSGVIADAEKQSGLRFREIVLGGWSAGCGAVRQILRDPASAERVARVVCIDGVHAGYANGAPGPQESPIDDADLDAWLAFGREAIADRKRLLITHSEIFPGTFASTTETADYLLRAWGLRPRPVVQWGPMGTQMLSRVRAGGLLVVGFAGNSAPDHVDQMQSLPEYLTWLMKL